MSCSSPADTAWDAKNITATLHQLFPAADSVFTISSAEAAADKNDSIGLPVPAFKAFVKEKDMPGYEFMFYFYNSSPADTALFIPLMRLVMIHDLKTALGNKEPGYLLTMPFFDSTGKDKMMAIALSAFTTKDSAYLSGKQKEIITAFGLKAISHKPSLVK